MLWSKRVDAVVFSTRSRSKFCKMRINVVPFDQTPRGENQLGAIPRYAMQGNWRLDCDYSLRFEEEYHRPYVLKQRQSCSLGVMSLNLA